MNAEEELGQILAEYARSREAPVRRLQPVATVPPAPAWRTSADLEGLPRPTFLPGVQGITSDGVHLVASASGVGKSQLALRWAVLVAREGIPVGYVPAEDEHQFTARLPALRRHYGDVVDAIRWWHQEPVLDGAEEFDKLLRRMSAEPVGLLIIDTLSAASGLYDEMKPDEVLARVRLAARLRAEGSCAVVVLAHSGWDTSRVMGSSAIRRELRTSWVLERHGGEGELRLRQDKCRIGAPLPAQYLRITDVTTADGETGPVLVEGDGSAQQNNAAKRLAVQQYLDEGEWPTKRLLATMANVSPTTAERALREAKAELD